MAETPMFNAEISAAVEESLARINYGATLAGHGITTVSLNEAGEIVEQRPDVPQRMLKRPVQAALDEGRP